MAAENIISRVPGSSNVMRFNEAAANGRGKHTHPAPPPGEGGASMRPRRMAAENESLPPAAPDARRWLQ